MAAEEDFEATAKEARIEVRLKKWKRATLLLGIVLSIAILTVVPFLKGHWLHRHWDSIGKNVLLFSMFMV